VAKKVRVLLCVSLFHVISGKAAMSKSEEDGNVYYDYVLVIHPLLTAQSKSVITQIAGLLSFQGVVDVSNHLACILDAPRFSGNTENKLLLLLKHGPDLTRWASVLQQVQDKIFSVTGENVDEIYVRYQLIKYEKFIIKNVYRPVPLFAVPECAIDESEIASKIARVRPLHIRKKYLFTLAATKLKETLPSLFLASKSRRYLPACRPYLPLFRNFEKKFCVTASPGRIQIDTECLDLLAKLNRIAWVQPNMKVIIAGTTIISDKANSNSTGESEFTITQECKVYNDLIKHIKKKHKVTSRDIYYKPHPRIRYDDWVYKQSSLDCQIYPYSKNGLIDIDLRSNTQVLAVYSYMSASILVAKLLFNVKSYFLDLHEYNLHWSHDELRLLCKKYGIESVRLPTR
jgi:hypothetical protein